MVGKSNQALILRDPFANRLLKRLSVQGPTLFQTLNSEIVLYPFEDSKPENNTLFRNNILVNTHSHHCFEMARS